jgi:hypothetical protein
LRELKFEVGDADFDAVPPAVVAVDQSVAIDHSVLPSYRRNRTGNSPDSWPAARGLRFDHELLYAGAMFHDMGLTAQHGSADERFEVDGANAARDFLRSHDIALKRFGRRSPCTLR